MSSQDRKIAVAVTGASGSIYAYRLLMKLNEMDHRPHVALVMSDNAKYVWKHELDNENFASYCDELFSKADFMAPFASGSSTYDSLVIVPCSMGALGRIAGGISNDLITRAADVMLKERKKLILVTRETPLNLIQITNMEKVTMAGGIICPASPSFYSKPSTIEQCVDTVVDRVIDLLGFRISTFRWNEGQKR